MVKVDISHKASMSISGKQMLRTRTSLVVSLALIAGLAFSMPLIDQTPDDFRLTGNDFELDILNVLTLLGVWFLTIARLLALLAIFEGGLAVFRAIVLPLWFEHWRSSFMVLFLPNKSPRHLSSLPLLI